MSLPYPSLRHGLVFSWLGDQVTGLTLVDGSGRGGRGSWAGASPQFIDGGVTFNGTANKFDVVERTGLTGNVPTTLSAWFRTNGVAGTIVNFGNVIGTGLIVRVGTNNMIYSGGPQIMITAANTITSRRWTHAAFAYPGTVVGETACFINGIETALTGSGNVAQSYVATSSPTVGSVVAAQYFNGQLADIRIYNRALTLAEIRLLASRRGIGLRYGQHFDDDADLQQYPIDSPPNRVHANVDGVWVPGQVRANEAGTWGNGVTRVNVAGVWTPPSFDPRSVPGLAAWYDAADSASITLDSGRVSQWSDKSGNARHATNTTSGSTQPSYTTAGRNGLNVLTFAAASVQRLTVAGTSTFNFLHNGVADSWWIAVSKYATSANPNAVYSLFGNISAGFGGPGVLCAWDNRTGVGTAGLNAAILNAGAPVANTLNAGNSAVLSAYNNLLTAQSFFVQEAIHSPSNATAADRFRFRVNGGSEIAANAKTGTASTSNAVSAMQFGGTGASALPLQGDVCELMFFNQLPTAADRNMIRQYLSAKWGVTLA